MEINVHAGHNPDGKVGCGAVGLIKESTEARLVKNEVITLLRGLGHTVYDCTCDNGKSQSDVLQQIIKKCNANEVDLDISIHFNSGANDKTGNGKSTGVEVLIYDSKNAAKPYAENTVNSISALGFRNRGIKYNTGLYYLRKAKAPAMLVECCFVDDKDDVNKYNYKTMAQAIVKGITGQKVTEQKVTEQKVTVTVSPNVPITNNAEFKVKIIDNALNIRAGAGTKFKVVGVIKDHGTYTITEVKNNWGKLKSGAGWISLDTKYVNRV